MAGEMFSSPRVTLPPRRYRQHKRDGVSEVHRRFVRSHECVLFGNALSECDIDHPIEAAHYRTAANSGAGLKPGDQWLLPFCREHHAEQHRIGQRAFEERYGISMAALAREFAAKSPDKAIQAAAR